MAPRMNQLLNEARNRGALIIHAPSSCMDAYKDHPARKRALQTPRARNMPKDIGKWCTRIPAEEKGKYPIDQTDGGEDDDPAEHRAWADKLKAMGRNPRAPWKTQTDALKILDGDIISDSGEEIWSVLEQRDINNVILVGVHTNMCVLGRPFGLRQMAKNGKNVVLVRDLTDTMYNPERAPYVSHFTGTDLIIEHVEKWVCPTITSDQLLGGKPFRFAGDKRPDVVIVMAEDEYGTNRTLPEFGLKHLGKDFRVRYLHASEKDRNDIPGLETLAEADVALISVRRRALPKEQMDAIRKFVADGKPVLGIRTASHAFSLQKKKPPEGRFTWEEFDHEVFGGNYTGHHGAGPKVAIRTAEGADRHPILAGVKVAELSGNGSLYKVSPLARKTTPLLIGSIPGKPAEPIAWVVESKEGKRFYTSLGHADDFKEPAFNRLLLNAVRWAAGR
jgi:nicotinamidase-related amidase/type 1 glutamine amidotransferase